MLPNKLDKQPSKLLMQRNKLDKQLDKRVKLLNKLDKYSKMLNALPIQDASDLALLLMTPLVHATFANPLPTAFAACNPSVETWNLL
jgi:hypothetical protein